jgi:hypothetical protein
MLPPLSVGTHTIHYSGACRFSDDPADYFGVEMTYNVSVE